MQHPVNNPIDIARAISAFFTYGFDRILGMGANINPLAPPSSTFHGYSRNPSDRRGSSYGRRAHEHSRNRPPAMHSRTHQRSRPYEANRSSQRAAGAPVPQIDIPPDVVSARPPMNALQLLELCRRTGNERAMASSSRPEGESQLKKVKLKELPFYTHISNILLDSYLAPVFSFSKKFSFKISSKTASDIDKEGHQVLLMLSHLDNTTQQDIRWPARSEIELNGKSRHLRGTSMPVNITEMCHLKQDSTNELKISSSKCRGETYVVIVSQMKKVPFCQVLDKLKAKKPTRKIDTQDLIKARLEQDSEGDIATTTFQCSLQCPIGMTRMTLPCRASTCKHIQCFDALVYIRMNECKPTWICPVCNCPAHFSDLLIDGYFQDILRKDKSSTKIKFHSNGSWSPVSCSESKEPAQDVTKNNPASKRKLSDVDEVVVIDLDDEEPPRPKDIVTDRNNNSFGHDDPKEITIEKNPERDFLQPLNAPNEPPQGRRRSSRNSVPPLLQQTSKASAPPAKRMRTRSRKNSQFDEECLRISADNMARRATRNHQTSRRQPS
ncbi:E3 SUMO-protein ligase PIAS2-like [Penaeus japonicus]|uniref:E3 SUMO-protein ligase PIAS2-like n=1 Tax=Penaeus japonicus TaxID=27405 RepID=UPI001C7154AE|nr:E3 SUMO-protein ligase PIAS2-like [Penaeus japonicus]